jgi:glucose/arabinose dehydrogenase
MKPRSLNAVVLVAFVAMFVCGSATAAPPDLATLKVPDGFRIAIFADDVPNARQMALGASGTLFVGSRDAGRVYAITHDGTKASAVKVIAKGLKVPSGIAFRDGSLYVAALDRVLRYDGIEQKLALPPAPVVVTDALPSDGSHGWKFIAFGPDGKLYVPVGAPCNICEPSERHGLIARMNPDGSGYEVIARGVRNTVGFDWNPADKKLWFTENGRDWMGDDQPPCELNRVDKPGQHFGYPYCHGGTIADPEFGDGHSCSDYVAPVLNFGAHTAPLGMRFYRGTQFPAAYRGGVFVTEHGSWNRSKKSGYRVLFVPVTGDKAGPAQDFVTGWLRDERVSGRPADVLELPDGSLLIADDNAGVIYRVSYGDAMKAGP